MNVRLFITGLTLLVGAVVAPAHGETVTQTVTFDADTIFENVETTTTVPFTLEGTFDKFNPSQGELLFVIFEAEAAFTFTINIDFFGGADVGVGGDIFADDVEISGLGISPATNGFEPLPSAHLTIARQNDEKDRHC